jgi:hypothetical protein
MGTFEFVFVAYSAIQIGLLAWLADRRWDLSTRLIGIMLSVLLVPLALVLQDGNKLADGGGVKNILTIAFLIIGMIVAAAVFFVRVWRARRKQG